MRKIKQQHKKNKAGIKLQYCPRGKKKKTHHVRKIQTSHVPFLLKYLMTDFSEVPMNTMTPPTGIKSKAMKKDASSALTLSLGASVHYADNQTPTHHLTLDRSLPLSLTPP